MTKRPLIMLLVLGVITTVISSVIFFMSEEKTTPTTEAHINLENQRYKKIVVIGIDGMDVKLTNKLMEEGHLPTFQSLAQNGSYMPLQTSYPPHTPVAFTNIATGVNPGSHNIFDFITVNRNNYLPELSTTKARNTMTGTTYDPVVKAPPFWKLSSDAQIPTYVMRWPLSFPTSPVTGHLFSGLGVPDIKGFLAGYSFYTNDRSIVSEKDTNKIVSVDIHNNRIETELFGPRKRKGDQIVDVTTPFNIDIAPDNTHVTLHVGEKSFEVEEGAWSPWIEASFKASIFQNVSGSFKAYLESIEPFRLYLTTMQINPNDPVHPVTFPHDLSKELAQEIGMYFTLGIPEETDVLVDENMSYPVFQEHIEQIEEERDKMFWYTFEKFKKEDTGILAFIYDASDRVQHTHFTTSYLADEDITIDPFIVSYYKHKDNFIKEVMSNIDDDTALIVLSDHGFTSYEKSFGLNKWLKENGYITLTNDRITKEDDGALFAYVDWSKTRAYALGFNSIYINMQGRERDGIVSLEEVQMLKEEIAQKLGEYVDEETGKHPIHKAHKKEDIYSGEFYDSAPDLIVGYAPGYRVDWKTAVGGFPTEILEANTKRWNGDHLVDPSFVPGVLFTNFDINKEHAQQFDIVPTIFDLIGLDIPEHLEGNPLHR